MAFPGFGPASFAMTRIQSSVDEARRTAESARDSVAELSGKLETRSGIPDQDVCEIRAALVTLEDSVAQMREEIRKVATIAAGSEREAQAASKSAEEAQAASKLIKESNKLAKDTKASQVKLAADMERLMTDMRSSPSP